MRIACALVHKQTHMGYNKTEQFIKDIYFTIKREVVRSVCKSCEACAITEPLKRIFPLINIKASSLRERSQIDFVNLINFHEKNEGYKHLINAIDIFSFFNMATKLKTKTGVELVSALKSIFQQYGYPKIIQHDNGKEFVNKEMFIF
ncbi:Gag-Pol polyprotein, partial [Cucumispora dikerogammari]